MKINQLFMIPLPCMESYRKNEYVLCKATLLCFYGAYCVKENIQMFGAEV